VLLSIPMFDTSMAILRRQLNGRKIGQGDRAHIHHCLRDRGLSPTQTLLAIGAMCSATATAVVLATVFNNDLIAIGICLAVLAGLIAFRFFGFNETILLARHFQAVGAFLKSMPRILRVKFVVVRLERTVAAGQLDLWHKIVKRAQRLDCVEIEFACAHVPSGRELTSLIWKSSEKSSATTATEPPVWQLHYAVPRGGGIVTRIRASGLAPHGPRLAWLNELPEMLVALCEHWPIAETAAIVDGPSPGEPIDEPHILTVPWGGPAHSPSQDETPRILGSDAA
jgi:hypothetical protein